MVSLYHIFKPKSFDFLIMQEGRDRCRTKADDFVRSRHSAPGLEARNANGRYIKAFSRRSERRSEKIGCRPFDEAHGRHARATCTGGKKGLNREAGL